MPKNPSILALLLLPPRSRRQRPKPPASSSSSSSSSSLPSDRVPLAVWLQAGGTGPPPLRSDFLSLARRRAERARLDREAPAAWDSEREAAYKAAEDVWGKRGGGGVLGGGGGGGGGRKMKGKELRAWYKDHCAKKDGGVKGKEVMEK